MRYAFSVLAVASVLSLSTAAYADMYLQGIGGDHSLSATNDRFYSGANKDFMGAAFNWSGVGQGPGGWLTMISPTYFVSANHAHPSGGQSVTFWEGNDKSDPSKSHTYTVDNWGYDTSYGGQSSDLWLGRLTTPLRPQDNIATYPVLKLANDAAYTNLDMLVYGYPNRVGRNTIGAILDDYEIGKTREMRYWFDSTPGTGSGPSDCYLVPGDSGGPSFAVVGGQLALLGIHFTNNSTNGVYDPEDSWPMSYGWSGDSFVPFYIDQLNAHMGSESVSTIPEPASVMLLLAGAGALLRARRRVGK